MEYRLKLSEPVEMYFDGYDEPMPIVEVYINSEYDSTRIEFLDADGGGYQARDIEVAPEAQTAIAGLKALAESLGEKS